MSKLSTHVLDTAAGKPAAGMRVELHRLEQSAVALVDVRTNSDGRTSAPLLQGDALTAGAYRLLFYVGDYFAAQDHPDARRFLNIVPVEFVVDDPARGYHVPLLVSPWSYSTYRGS